VKALLAVLMIILAAAPAYSQQVIIEETLEGSISYQSNISVGYRIFNPADRGVSIGFYFPAHRPQEIPPSSYQFGEKKIYLSPGETFEETYRFTFPLAQPIGLWKGLELRYPVQLIVDPEVEVEFTRKGRLRVEMGDVRRVVCQGCRFEDDEVLISQEADLPQRLDIHIQFAPPLRAGLFYSIMILGLIAFVVKRR